MYESTLLYNIYIVKNCTKKLNVYIHGLRHKHTSVLIFKGLDISYISKRLGHANIVETLETYAHIIDEFNQVQDTKAAEVLDNLIFSSAK